MSTKSETSSKLRAVLTGSVVQKLVNIGASSALEKYSTLMFAFSTDGVLNGLEKKLLEEYRDAHHITPQQHLQCLQRIGWSEDEYKRGLQKDCAQAVYPMFFAFSDKLGDLLKDFNAKKPSSQIMQDLQISKKSNDDGPSTTINNKSSS